MLQLLVVGMSLLNSAMSRIHSSGGIISVDGRSNVAPGQCDRIKQAVRATAGVYCNEMIGHGKECVVNCNKIVDQKAKEMMMARHATHMLSDYKKCWVARRCVFRARCFFVCFCLLSTLIMLSLIHICTAKSSILR